MSVLLVFVQIYDYSANSPKCPTTRWLLSASGTDERRTHPPNEAVSGTDHGENGLSRGSVPDTRGSKVILCLNQTQYHFVRVYLIRIAQLLARSVGQLYAAVDVLAGVDLEGLEFHYYIERLNRTYVVGEVGADAE